MNITKTLLIAALLAGACAAQAHITLEQASAEAGSAYKAVFKVGHGCEGSATHSITVTLPPGFANARPTPKAGWTLATSATEISWTAKTADDDLQDSWYDEFVLRGKLPEQPGDLWFKVRQTCIKSESNWADVPAEGASTQGLKTPAAHLTVMPRSADAMPAEHHH